MDIGKLLLLGAAGYVAYEYFLKPGTVAPPATGGSGVISGPTPPVTPAANPMTTQSLILAAAAKDNVSTTSADGWGYYYAKARGIPAPSPDVLGFTADNVNEILTFPEWWNMASSHGLSGYHPTNRLGIMEAQ